MSIVCEPNDVQSDKSNSHSCGQRATIFFKTKQRKKIESKILFVFENFQNVNKLTVIS